MQTVCFFSDSARKTPIGYLHRLIWIHIPSLLNVLDAAITGGRAARAGAQTGHYLMKEKHPLVMVKILNDWINTMESVQLLTQF